MDIKVTDGDALSGFTLEVRCSHEEYVALENLRTSLHYSKVKAEQVRQGTNLDRERKEW